MSVDRLKHWLARQIKQAEIGEVKVSIILENCEQGKRLPPKPTGSLNSIFVIQLHLRICSCSARVFRVSMDTHGKFGEHESKRTPRGTLAS